MKNIHINMNKKLIRLTESDLHRIVKESVNKVLRENHKNFQRTMIREFDDDDYEDSDDIEWRIDDICDEFGNSPVLIKGTLGLWDGQKRIIPVEAENMRSAIYKCIGRDGEIMSPNDIDFDYDRKIVTLTVHHHDGTNNFKITSLY